MEFKEVLVTSARETWLEISLRERVTELEEVSVRPQVHKEKAMNPMAVTGARMLSVEEAGRYAGGMDDPARLASSFAGVAPNVSNNGISVHGNAPPICCNGAWKMWRFPIPTISRISPHWGWHPLFTQQSGTGKFRLLHRRFPGGIRECRFRGI